jgi:hypothetical protein
MLLAPPPRFVAADSSILEETYGEGWAAVWKGRVWVEGG